MAQRRLQSTGKYRVIPKPDLKDVEFEFRATKSGLHAAYIGKIDGATSQRGEGTFPNEIVSPSLGRSPWATALRSMWIEAELNGHRYPVHRRVRATEIMRRLCGRGFDDEEGRHLLGDRGEIGKSVAGNALYMPYPRCCQMWQELRSSCYCQRSRRVIGHRLRSGRLAVSKDTQG